MQTQTPHPCGAFSHPCTLAHQDVAAREPRLAHYDGALLRLALDLGMRHGMDHSGR